MTKKTKIVCTIGPASESKEVLSKLVDAGMNVMRVNMSHGDYDGHSNKMQNIREVAKEKKLPIAILLDTKGPEIRTHLMKDGKINLVAGQKLYISMEEVEGTEEKISVTYSDLINDVQVGDNILIDDGLVETKVVDKIDGELLVEVKNDGELVDRRGINVPGVSLNFIFMSEKDKKDLLFGIKQNVDFVAASFVRRSSDVNEIREFLIKNGGENIKIISKVECQEAIEKFDDILEASDGIMVARGDLGVEVPIEELPSMQKMMIEKCNRVGKPVITATQMLESMKTNPRPTRAEITDVANAIYDGTSAIMLSAESATGKYPIQSVETMSKIAIKTEKFIINTEEIFEDYLRENADTTQAISHATSSIASLLDAKLIVAVTKTGGTANQVAKLRNNIPVVAVTNNDITYRQLSLSWGVTPLLGGTPTTIDESFEIAVEVCKENGLADIGDRIVITAGTKTNVKGKTNTLKVHRIRK